VDSHDFVAGAAESHISGSLDNELEELVGALEGRHLVTNNTSGTVELSDNGVGYGAGKDRAVRAILRDQAGELARVGEDNDEVDVAVVYGSYGSGGDGFSGRDGSGRVGSGIGVESLVVDSSFGFSTNTRHNTDSEERVGSVSGLSGEHDTVRSIEDGVGDIRSFGTGRAGSVDHGLEHLSSSDNGLGSEVGLLNHPLLGDENFLWGNFHTKISTGDHDSVGGFEDLIVVVESFLVFNLGDNLNVGTSGSEDVTDGFNVFGLSYERCGNHVNTVLETEIA